MKQSTCNSLGAGLLVLGLALALPAYAQMGGGMMDGQKGGMMDGGKGMDSGARQKDGGKMGGPGAQQMSGTMHDMSGQMTEMSSRMSKGNMSAAEQKQMA